MFTCATVAQNLLHALYEYLCDELHLNVDSFDFKFVLDYEFAFEFTFEFALYFCIKITISFWIWTWGLKIAWVS